MTGAIEFLRKLKVICDIHPRCLKCPLDNICMKYIADIENEADLVRTVMNYQIKGGKMREIKFRGQSVATKKWIYGYPVKNLQGWIFIIEEGNINKFTRVIPETVGQYTGLKDKNGKEIYEGDIIEIVYCNSKYMGKVIFNEKTCGFEIWYNSVVGVYGEKATHKINFAMDIEIKVIGNIYDNPENQEVGHE